MYIAAEAKFDMLRRLRVADYLTLSNALCGVLSMFFSLQSHFITAYVLIFLGYEFDRYDGIVARWRNECSDWGQQLDSLSDLVTFVIAPVVMLYSLGFRTAVDQLALAFFALCGVMRLARFNVVANLVPKDAKGKALYQEGFSTAYAALFVSTIVAAFAWLDWISAYVFPTLFTGTWFEVHPTILLVVGLGATMISKRLRFTADLAVRIPVMTGIVFLGCWVYSPR